MADKKTKNSKKQRTVPKKNYWILLLLCLLAGLIFWLIIEPFKKKDIEQDTLLSETLFEINYGELNGYITERQNIVLYLTDFKEENEAFEKKLKNLIIDESIKDRIIYININNLTTEEIKKISKNYFSDKLLNSNITLDVIPNILIFEDGKTVDILYKTKSTYDIKEVKVFFEKYGVIEND